MVLRKNFAPLDFVQLLEASKYFRQHYLHTCREICTTTMLDNLRNNMNVDLSLTMRFNIIEFTLSKDPPPSLVPNKMIEPSDVAVAARNMFQQVAEGGRVVLSFQDALALSTIVHSQALLADYHDNGRIDISHVDSVIETEPLFPDHQHFLLFPRADGKNVIEPTYNGRRLFALAKGFCRDIYLRMLFTSDWW